MEDVINCSPDLSDKSGKFQLKSKSEAERLEKERNEHSKRVSKKYIQQRSILERESTIQRFKSFRNVPQPSRQHTESWSCDPDNSESDLDLIPTKDRSAELDGLYAKVDKSRPVVAKDGNVQEEIFEIPVIRKDDMTSVKHTMSDIEEGAEYTVQVGQKSNHSIKATVHSIEDEDSDDYTKLDFIPVKKESEGIVVNVRKESKALGELLYGNSTLLHVRSL